MIINQFESDPLLQNLIVRHRAWHSYPDGFNGFPSRPYEAGAENSGRDFFQFHRDIMNEFLAWNASNGNPIPNDLLTGWTEIPSFLKNLLSYTRRRDFQSLTERNPNGHFSWTGTIQEAEDRIMNDQQSFDNDDEYGIFVEHTVHNWLHGAVAFWLNNDDDPNNDDRFIGTFNSPRSTYFYQIHSLIDLYWTNFGNKSFIKDILDTKRNSKESIKESVKEIKEKDNKEFKEFKEIKEKDRKEFKEIKEKDRKEFKEKEKDIFEGGGINPDDFRNSEIINLLNERISKIEFQTQKGKMFISKEERPDVGKKLTKKKNK